MGLLTRRNKPKPTAKIIQHQKTAVLRMEFGLDLLREPQAGEIVAQFAKRRIEEFKLREGLDGSIGNETGNEASD